MKQGFAITLCTILVGAMIFASPVFADDYAYLLTEITGLRTDFMLLESKVANHDSSISSLELKDSRLESAVSHLEKETEPEHDPYANPYEEKKTLRAEVEDSKSKISDLQSTVSSLESEVRELKDETARLRRQKK